MNINEITEEFKKTQQILGRGACSIVYKYKGKAVKVLNENGRQMADTESVRKMIGKKNDTFVFLEQVMEDDENTVYVMEIVEGKGFIDDDIIKQLNIPELIKAIHKVETDIHQISEEGIVTNDMNHKNIKWDFENKRVRIIDTDSFIKNEELSAERIYAKNLEEFNLSIRMILGCLGSENFEILRQSPEFSERHMQYVTQEFLGKAPSIIPLIEILVEVAEKQYGRKFGSLQEIEQVIEETKEDKMAQNARDKFVAEILNNGKYGEFELDQAMWMDGELNMETGKRGPKK